MKIVFLDAKTIGEDIDLSGFDALGEVVKYGFSTTEEARERSKDADVLILNKVQVNQQTIGEADHLKLVCVTATGTNNLDKEYLDKRGIAWRNVAGYSTESVAQHTFAMLFYLLEKLPYYDDYVKSEKYVNDVSFTHFAKAFHELSGMTYGIIGLGNIGRRVADIAKAFGFVDKESDNALFVQWSSKIDLKIKNSNYYVYYNDLVKSKKKDTINHCQIMNKIV